MCFSLSFSLSLLLFQFSLRSELCSWKFPSGLSLYLCVCMYSPCSCSSYSSCEKLNMENSILRSCAIANIEIVLPLLISKQWCGFFLDCWTISQNGQRLELIFPINLFNIDVELYLEIITHSQYKHENAVKTQRSAKIGASNGTCFNKTRKFTIRKPHHTDTHNKRRGGVNKRLNELNEFFSKQSTDKRVVFSSLNMKSSQLHCNARVIVRKTSGAKCNCINVKVWNKMYRKHTTECASIHKSVTLWSAWKWWAVTIVNT